MSLRLGSQSVLVSQGLALAALAVASACSSGSSNVVSDEGGNSSSGASGSSSSATTSSGSSSGASTSSGSSSSATTSSGSSSSATSSSGSSTSSSGSGGGLVIEAGADGGCPDQSTVVLGAHIKFSVAWASSLAANAGTGSVDIWLLSHSTSSGTGDLMFAGTAQSCGTTLPDIALNSIGTSAVCAPGHTCGTKVSIQILPSTFAKITRTFPNMGMQTGWNPGSTLTTVTAMGLLGLTQASPYSMDTTAWPNTSGCTSNCTPFGVFMSSYNSDDDMDGNPGITANPKNDTGSSPVYTYPPTETTFFSIPPLADQVYIVSRNEVALTGMRMNDCTHGSGTSKITLFDNHVVGCHATATSTDGDKTFSGPAGTCDSSQVAFLDDNRTIYTASNGNAASPSNAIMGTVNVVELSASATCADALNIP